MDQTKIETYIENGLELELLDKLNSYSITEFNPQCKNIIKILLILLEKSKIDWIQPNQALIKIITKILPEILGNTESIQTFISLLKNNTPAPFLRTSYLCRQLIVGIGDDELKKPQPSKEGQLEAFQTELKNINIYFLTEVMKSQHPHNTIFELFYNCIDEIEKDNRQIILCPEAIELIKEYIFKNPADYIKFFIRPNYTGTVKGQPQHYRHVPEPFYEQILPEQEFIRFLNVVREKNIDNDLISDLGSFHDRIKEESSKSGEKSIILFSNEMYNAFNHYETASIEYEERFLKLKSNAHSLVRRECMPPKYMA